MLPFQDCFEYASPEQSKGAGKPNPWRTLAVPKFAMRLGAPRDFDRCELSAFASSSTGRARRKALVPHVGSGRERGHGFDADSLQAKQSQGGCPVIFLVGVTGFEPMASWSRTKRTTKLCHTPAKIQSYGLQLCCLRPKRRQTVPHPDLLM